MEDLDICYLCTLIANLSGIPVRIFNQGSLTFFHSVVHLPKDPLTVYQSEILQIKEHISYFSTEHFHYYGIVNSGAIKIVVGPTRQIPDTEQELRELAFRADVEADDVEDFISGMQGIVRMPLESVMQMLCTVNYVLNGEKKSLQNISILDSVQQQIILSGEQKHTEKAFSDEPSKQDYRLHNTYDLEQTMMNMIRKGDSAALREWIAHAPAVRGGVLAPDQLRQRKNTFIVTATLSSRAAIRGGLTVDDAFTLSDSYIQKCELLNNPNRIMNLQYHMVLDFTERVERLRKGRNPSQLIMDVSNYILHHMSEAISVEAMAKELFMSRTYLSKRFKAESGETLTDFILKEKTEEAKRLLRYSDKSLTAIGLYLGFSSQSHFSRVFRKYAALSPGEYRQKHTK
ncbi:MAG: helix-turn-helix domain-containing protein [Lachnospiraceae bacterium]|nr:helix-turn-helix domain-containing protein [Lachnospiraceae bacterium]